MSTGAPDQRPWNETLPRPFRYFLLLGALGGGLAMVITGAERLVRPDPTPGLVYWLSAIGFMLIGLYLAWQGSKLFWSQKPRSS